MLKLKSTYTAHTRSMLNIEMDSAVSFNLDFEIFPWWIPKHIMVFVWAMDF